MAVISGEVEGPAVSSEEELVRAIEPPEIGIGDGDGIDDIDLDSVDGAVTCWSTTP
jgi:hypothetical protein